MYYSTHVRHPVALAVPVRYCDGGWAHHPNSLFQQRRAIAAKFTSLRQTSVCGAAAAESNPDTIACIMRGLEASNQRCVEAHRSGDTQGLLELP